MKKHYFITGLLFFSLLFGVSGFVFGQFQGILTPNLYPEVGTGLTGLSPRKTGNDILSISQGGYTQVYFLQK